MGNATINGLLEIVHFYQLDNDHLKNFFKHAYDHMDMEQRSKCRVLLQARLQVRTLQEYVVSLTRFAVQDKQYVMKVVRKQVSPASPISGFMFHPGHDSSARREWQKHTTTSPYFRNDYNAVQQVITKVGNPDGYWIDDAINTLSSRHSFIQLLAAKSATS